MSIFLFILLAGLVLIYANLSAVIPGKRGKLLALGVLVAIFAGMSFRGTLAGSAVVAFTSSPKAATGSTKAQHSATTTSAAKQRARCSMFVFCIIIPLEATCENGITVA